MSCHTIHDKSMDTAPYHARHPISSHHTTSSHTYTHTHTHTHIHITRTLSIFRLVQWEIEIQWEFVEGGGEYRGGGGEARGTYGERRMSSQQMQICIMTHYGCTASANANDVNMDATCTHVLTIMHSWPRCQRIHIEHIDPCLLLP